ncbi:MAG: hypothetical protein N2234_04220 [Planctomycetota bacterium]|nr:hypothetical protein [Planctomycetota bacterium]
MKKICLFLSLAVIALFLCGCRSSGKSSQRAEEYVHPLDVAVNLISEGDEIAKRALRTYYPQSRRSLLLTALDRYASARLILLKELSYAAFDYQRENIAKLLRVVEASEETTILFMPLPPKFP